MLGWDIGVGILVTVAKEGDFKDLREVKELAMNILNAEIPGKMHISCKAPRWRCPNHELQITTGTQDRGQNGRLMDLGEMGVILAFE